MVHRKPQILDTQNSAVHYRCTEGLVLGRNKPSGDLGVILQNEIATATQIIMLVISAVTLVYLIKYVGATEVLARQSVKQVEATFRPALVCLPGRSLDEGPRLVNIGMGPAMEVEWHLSATRDRIPYLLADRAQHLLRHFAGMKPLFETTMPIVINYKSISGASYCSVCTYNVDRDEFSTTFSG